MQQVHDLLLGQGLLHQEAEENGVPEFAEVVEELRAGVRVLHNVLQGGLVIAEDPGRAVVIPRKLALVWHGLHQGLCELHNVALDQALDDLEQLLHDDGDPLVAQQLGHAPKMRGADEAGILREHGVVGNVQRLAAPMIVVGHDGRFLAMHGLGETDVTTLDKSVGGSVVAIVGQEIIVELPEKLESDPSWNKVNCNHIYKMDPAMLTIWGKDIMVGLL